MYVCMYVCTHAYERRRISENRDERIATQLTYPPYTTCALFIALVAPLRSDSETPQACLTAISTYRDSESDDHARRLLRA